MTLHSLKVSRKLHVTLNMNFQYHTGVCALCMYVCVCVEGQRKRNLLSGNLDYTIGIHQWDKFWLEETLCYIKKLIAMLYSPDMLIGQRLFEHFC